MPNEPIAHLVWLQGRRAPDDVEDYYEVARPGDTSVDGSDPFPVYAASTSDAERHERSPKSNMLEIAIAAVLEADKEFRSNMPSEWDGDPLSGELDGLRRIFEAHLSAPPPPAAVQEPVVVKVKPLEWDDFGRAFSEVGTYNVVCIRSGVFGLTKPEDEEATFPISREGSEQYCRDEAQIDYEQRIRSALSTSQSDPAPEIVALPQDVINLVIAAREVFEAPEWASDEWNALDKALEAFSSRVPYENEPDAVAPEQEEAK